MYILNTFAQKYVFCYFPHTYIHTYAFFVSVSFLCICIHTYIRTYVRTLHTYLHYIHSYTHTHTHTYIRTGNQEQIGAKTSSSPAKTVRFSEETVAADIKSNSSQSEEKEQNQHMYDRGDVASSLGALRLPAFVEEGLKVC